MELIDLKAELRQDTGKSVARTLRRTEKLPAIVYGAKIDPVMLSVGTIEFDKIVRDHGTQGVFLSLAVKGEEGKCRTVVLKEVQMDVYQKVYLHVDFQEIDMEAKLTVSVPVTVVGVAKGVEEGGGLLQIIRRDLDVICKPVDVPEEVAIDVSAMEIGDAIHVEDINIGDNITIPYDVNFTIITLIPPTAEDASEEDDLLEEEEGAIETEPEATSEEAS